MNQHELNLDAVAQYIEQNRQLREQLAAERSKQQTLVDALKGINLVVLESNRTQRRSREESLKLLETMCADALAKVSK